MPVRFLLFLLAATVMAACGRPEQPPDPGIDRQDTIPPPDLPSSAAPGPGTLGAVQDALTYDQAPVTRRPGEIIRLDPANVIAISVIGDGFTYDIERDPQPRLIEDGQPRNVSAGAVEALLRRFAPLEGAEVLADVPAPPIRDQPTHRILFHFEDESTRDIAMVRRGDYVAVAAQADGPVFRLLAARLPELIPSPDAMR